MRLACRALQGQEAPQGLKETEAPLVSVEALEMLGQQGLPEPWVHQDLQEPKGPQDRRGKEVLLGTKEQRERAGFPTSPL